MLSGKTEFGQFPPYTDAERELEKMLHGKDKDIDLALASWLVVADIPQFHDMTREAYFKQLDDMTEQIRQNMAIQTIVRHRSNPNSPIERCGNFVDAVHKLGFTYSKEFGYHDLTPLQNKALYADANNIFLAGLMRTKQGSCVSMPLIYLVIGQRFGFPVHLVAIGKHYFIRWEEPGFRMNIETTITERACLTPDDSVYMDDEGITREQLKGSDLRNLTNREVVGHFFFARACHWVMRTPKCRSQSWMDISRAFHLSPDDTAITKTHEAVFSHYGITPEDTLNSIKQKEMNSM